MKFDDLDKELRIFETAHDHCVLPGMYMVARLDGRGFTRLTKKMHDFEKPFDARFRDYMIETTKHLMSCGFEILYGYTESDEISLLFALEAKAFGRKTRKMNSVLAGEASAKFSLLLGDIGVFDCRISQIPARNKVVDYFRWRNEDAFRNALSAHCYWALRKEGATGRQATKAINGLSIAEKNELLFQRGINFNDLPSWQKRGVGLYWTNYLKKGKNPKTGEEVETTRRKLHLELDLPMRDAYSDFVGDFLLPQSAQNGYAIS